MPSTKGKGKDDSETEEDDPEEEDRETDEEEDDDQEEKPEAPKGTEKLKSALVKERTERKRLEKELKKARDAEKAKQDGETATLDQTKGENLRLKQENETLAKKLRDQGIHNALMLKASEMNLHNPKVALKLLDSETLEDLADADGNVDDEAVEEALKNLVKENKYLLKPKKGKGEDDDEEEDDEETPEIGAQKGGRVTRQSKDAQVKARKDALSQTGNYAG